MLHIYRFFIRKSTNNKTLAANRQQRSQLLQIDYKTYAVNEQTEITHYNKYYKR